MSTTPQSQLIPDESKRRQAERAELVLPHRESVQAAHPRGEIVFYCGNCCVLTVTPGYCTACGAMLKLLDADNFERSRQKGDHDHHLLPSVFDRTIGYWEAAGLKRNEFCVSIPEAYHRQVHPSWNREWEWFIMDHPKATREQILAQMREMMNDYDLSRFRIHGFRSEG